jgi:Mrp family chromosome partitioning ATPase
MVRMNAPRLLFVTGKGGAGKTTVTAALGARLAEDRKRVLIVELAGDRGLAQFFGREHLASEPAVLAPRLFGVRVERRALVEAYFRRILRLNFLSERLLGSVTFNALTAAAPGVSEFLALEHLVQWLDGGRRRRGGYDVVLVDAPATGHALRFLRTPLQLTGVVPAGPLGSTARRILTLLRDPAATQVLLVSTADEMSVGEAVEARDALRGDLALALARPVLNRMPGQRFTATETSQVTELSAHRPAAPLLRAARLQIAARREAEQLGLRLRRAFGSRPVHLPEVSVRSLERADLDYLGRILVRSLFE